MRVTLLLDLVLSPPTLIKPSRRFCIATGTRCRVFEQKVGEEWADFDLCSLVGDSATSATEVLLVDAHLFHDIIYPGVDLCYSMEVRSLVLTSPVVVLDAVVGVVAVFITV